MDVVFGAIFWKWRRARASETGDFGAIVFRAASYLNAGRPLCRIDLSVHVKGTLCLLCLDVLRPPPSYPQNHLEEDRLQCPAESSIVHGEYQSNAMQSRSGSMSGLALTTQSRSNQSDTTITRFGNFGLC